MLRRSSCGNMAPDLSDLGGVDGAVARGGCAAAIAAAAGRRWRFVEVPADGEEADQRDCEELGDVD